MAFNSFKLKGKIPESVGFLSLGYTAGQPSKRDSPNTENAGP